MATLIPQNPIQEPVSNPTPVSEPKAKDYKLIAVGLVVILILLSSTIYLGYQNYQLRKQIAQIQTSLSPSPTPTATTDPTANWKTYEDKENNFSIDYPSNWDVQKTTDNLISIDLTSHEGISVGGITIDPINYRKITIPIKSGIEIYNNKLLAGKDSGSTGVSTISIHNGETPIIGGEKAVKAFQVGGMDEITLYFFVHNGKLFTIETISYYDSTREQNKDIENQYSQILSTFRFVRN